MTLTLAEASAIAGMKEEIVGVDVAPAGDVIHVKDGTVLVLVPEDEPDAEGKTGLMFLVAPLNEKGKYLGTFPVYSQPTDEPTGEIDELAELAAANIETVKAYAEDHPHDLEAIIAGEVAGKGRKSLLSMLTELLEARNAASETE